MVNNAQPIKIQRQSNIELYRIITMLFIIAHHYVVNSGLTGVDGPIYGNYLAPRSIFLLLFGAWGKTGINCFVIISGYFMCKSKITANKLFKLLFEWIFYRMVINGLYWITGYHTYTLRSYLNWLIPFKSVGQNFTGTYVLFFLCIPFLNKLVANLSEIEHLRLILLGTFIYVFFETMPSFSVDMNYVSWFVVLFFIASYIRLYPKPIFNNKKFWGIATLIAMGLSSASVIFCSYLGQRTGRYMSFALVTDSNTFLALLTSVCSFLYFKNVNLKYNKYINLISSTTFGVFLIHTTGDTTRKWLWRTFLNNVGMYDSPYMPLHAIGSVFLVFAVCCCVDLLRMRFVERPFSKCWNKVWSKVAVGYDTLEYRFCKKFQIHNEADNKK